jgi:hypothetical protein
MQSSDEKRHFARVRIDGRAGIVCGDAQWATELVDISLKGALIQRPEGWQGGRGDECRLELLLDGSSEGIRMQGTIAHVGDHHIGFRCEFIDLDSIGHLKRLLQLNLGDDSLLHRELQELVG